MDMHTLHRQDGAALVVGLLLLLVMTMIGVGAMSNINIEERMAGNQKRMADAQMAAEAGVKLFYEWLAEDIQGDPNCVTSCVERRWDNSEGWEEAMPTDPNGAANYGDVAYFYIESWERNGDIGTLHVRGQGKEPGGTRTLSDFALEAVFTERTGENCDLNEVARAAAPMLAALPPEFQIPACGIVAEDQIHLNGETHVLDGSLHSEFGIEADWAIEISGSDSTIENGTVSAVGEVDVPESWWEDGVVFEHVDPWDLEAIPEEMFTEVWPALANEVRTDCGSAAQPWEVTGDQGGQLIVCTGDAHIEGKFNNLNLVVNGNLVHDGALKGEGFDGIAGTNLIIANGDITFNGASGTARQEFDGIFWANGTFQQNGRAFILGAVITTEGAELGNASDVTFDGNLEFKGLKDQEFLGENRRLAIVGWRQVWN